METEFISQMEPKLRWGFRNWDRLQFRSAFFFEVGRAFICVKHRRSGHQVFGNYTNTQVEHANAAQHQKKPSMESQLLPVRYCRCE